MSSEIAPVISAKLGSEELDVISGSVILVYDEPSEFTLVLDNTDGTYNDGHDLSDPDSLSEFVKITITDTVAETSWDSPDFIVEDYDYNTDEVTISGFCRLSKLTVSQQSVEVADGVSTLEDTTLATALSLIGSAYGFTFSGVPTRDIPGPYQLVGSPLQWIDDLLGPTHIIRMGAGNQILVESSTSHATATALVDEDDLEILTFRRTKASYNKVIVERLVQQAGKIVLFDQAQSGGDKTGIQGPFTFSEPSRTFFFEIKEGARGEINSISPKGTDPGNPPVGAQPLDDPAYVGTEAVGSFTFVYELSPDWATWGEEFTPNWRIRVTGYPLTVDPIPLEGYSATATHGAGDRPYPHVYESTLFDGQTEAQAAADALLDRFVREGNALNVAIDSRVDFPLPNQEVPITDTASGISESPVIEMVTIAWDEGGDWGTITLEGSFGSTS